MIAAHAGSSDSNSANAEPDPSTGLPSADSGGLATLALGFGGRGAARLSDESAVLGAERVALELAEAMTEASVSISDELYARLQEHFDEPQLVELAGPWR